MPNHDKLQILAELTKLQAAVIEGRLPDDEIERLCRFLGIAVTPDSAPTAAPNQECMASPQGNAVTSPAPESTAASSPPGPAEKAEIEATEQFESGPRPLINYSTVSRRLPMRMYEAEKPRSVWPPRGKEEAAKETIPSTTSDVPQGNGADLAANPPHQDEQEKDSSPRVATIGATRDKPLSREELLNLILEGFLASEKSSGKDLQPRVQTAWECVLEASESRVRRLLLGDGTPSLTPSLRLLGPDSDTAVESTSEGYVALAHSKVFHRPECRAVKGMADRVVKYATRDEVVQLGKKPCAQCKP